MKCIGDGNRELHHDVLEVAATISLTVNGEFAKKAFISELKRLAKHDRQFEDSE